ncbi:hypothetical protein ACHAW6_009606, partial [Cyclotella cf. meneghiniana]
MRINAEWSCHQQTCTEEMQQSRQSKHSKDILSQYWWEYLIIFLSINGTNYYHKQSSHSTSFDNQIFDYNRISLAPMGCAVHFHIKPNKRKSWGNHSRDGWHLRSSPEHYRSWVVFVKQTRSKRITDT